MLQDRALYTPRDDRTAKYRGNELTRSKFYVNFAEVCPEQPGPVARACGLTQCPLFQDGTAKYGFPGFQYAAMLNYKSYDDPAYHFVTSLKDKLQGGLRVGDVEMPAPHFTQAIATMYENGSDGIGWHSDKVLDITEGSIIFDLSLGAERIFSLGRANGKKAPTDVQNVTMRHGSAILLSTKTNNEYKHAVLPVAGLEAPRVSLVLRDIKTVVTELELQKKLGGAVGGWGYNKAQTRACMRSDEEWICVERRAM